MKFHVDKDNAEKRAEAREKEMREAESKLTQQAQGQVAELKEILTKKTRS